MNDRSLAATAVGVLYVLIGLSLLLLTLDLFTVRWDVAGPLLMMGAGAVVLADGAVRLRHGRRVTR